MFPDPYWVRFDGWNTMSIQTYAPLERTGEPFPHLHNGWSEIRYWHWMNSIERTLKGEFDTYRKLALRYQLVGCLSTASWKLLFWRLQDNIHKQLETSSSWSSSWCGWICVLNSSWIRSSTLPISYCAHGISWTSISDSTIQARVGIFWARHIGASIQAHAPNMLLSDFWTSDELLRVNRSQNLTSCLRAKLVLSHLSILGEAECSLDFVVPASHYA